MQAWADRQPGMSRRLLLFGPNFRKPKSSESDTGRQAVSLISNTKAENIAAAGGRQVASADARNKTKNTVAAGGREAASADKRNNGRQSGRLR